MDSASEYLQRSKKCFERAQIMTNSVDRGRWLQLAEQWAMLSRMPRPKATLFRNNPIGFWRGEPPSNSKGGSVPWLRSFRS